MLYLNVEGLIYIVGALRTILHKDVDPTSKGAAEKMRLLVMHIYVLKWVLHTLGQNTCLFWFLGAMTPSHMQKLLLNT